MPKIPSPPVLAGAVVGGWALGRRTGDRRLAGAVLLTGVGALVPRWSRRSPLLAAGVAAGTVALVGLSHPLAHRVGPWPAVLSTAAAAGALAAVADRSSRPA